MDDASKRRALTGMKARATALLVIASVIFVVSRALEDHATWIGFVRATAEAAMVGALADWFAVTALFRHPLRIPIPHTAIIPERKDQIGESLGEFVQENFLSPAVVGEKLRSANVARRGADWLADSAHADSIGRNVSAVIAGLVDVLRDEDVQETIERAVVGRVRSVSLAPLASRVLDVVTAQGRHRELIDAAIRGLRDLLDERRETFRASFAKESPWWVPEPIDDRIFDKLFNGIDVLLADILGDPNHEVRRHFDERMVEVVERLRTSPEMLARGEELKEELLDHPAVRAWTGSLWADMKSSLVRQSADPASELRRRIDSTVRSLADTLRNDVVLQGKVDRWIEAVVLYVVDEYRHEVAELIAGTVRKWDPHETADRIELQIGRDLQFIRINGTIVGGLAGLVIFSVGRLL